MKTFFPTLVVLLLFSACTPEASWDFSTNYFEIEINNKGYITSMKNNSVRPYREFSPSDKPSPLLSLYNTAEKVYYRADGY